MEFLAVCFIKIGMLAIAVALAIFCDHTLGSPVIRFLGELQDRTGQ